MYAIKFNRVFQISSIASLCFIFCACQMNEGESVEPPAQVEHTQGFNNEYSKALELVHTYIGHEDSYIPLRQNISGESIVSGDINGGIIVNRFWY